MSVKILYFGQLKDVLGKSQCDLNLSQPMKVEDVFCQVLGDNAHLKAWQEKVLYAVNQELVSRDFQVHDGDEVAFMPPMAGG